MPDSRPMPRLGSRVHELRVRDDEGGVDWRIIYRIDPDAIVVAHWFSKRTRTTPRREIDQARRRLREYDR